MKKFLKCIYTFMVMVMLISSFGIAIAYEENYDHFPEEWYQSNTICEPVQTSGYVYSNSTNKDVIKWTYYKKLNGATNVLLFENVSKAEQKKNENNINLDYKYLYFNDADFTKSNATKIGVYAFWNTSVKFCRLSNKITHIAYGAFEYCENLEVINLKKVKHIDQAAFRRSGLINLTVPYTVTRIGESAFYGCRDLTKVTIGNGVTKLETETFGNCEALKTVKLGKNITELKDGVFSGTKSLKTISLPSKLKTIGTSCFYNSGLTEIGIPKSVTTISKGAFYNCKDLDKVVIRGSKTKIAAKSIGYYRTSNKNYKKNKDLVIYGKKNSTAQKYAKKYGFEFKVLK